MLAERSPSALHSLWLEVSRVLLGAAGSHRIPCVNTREAVCTLELHEFTSTVFLSAVEALSSSVLPLDCENVCQ